MSRLRLLAGHGWSWLLDYGYVVRHQLGGLVRPSDPGVYRWGHPHEAPVLLLPGIYERWQFMRPVADLLHGHGHQVHVLTRLGWNTAPVAASATQVAAYLRENDLRDVVIVAHSKGGLIGKYTMLHEDPDGRVARMIAIASPFAGSRYARFLPHPHLRAFSPVDRTVREMGAQVEVNRRITSIWGAFDPHIPGGSRLPGAENIPLRTSGHFRIIGQGELLDAVERAAHVLG